MSAQPAGVQRYRVRHATRYEYAADVAHAHHLLHLAPRPTARQICRQFALELEPTPTVRGEHQDAFGNTVTRIEIDRPHRALDVVATLEVELPPRAPVRPENTEPWERVRDRLRYRPGAQDPAQLEALRYRGESPHVPIRRAFAEWAADCFTGGRPLLVGAEALMHRIHEEFEYAPGATQIGTPLLEVLDKKRGVCQDYAHFMIACLRSLGLAARYVSGYLRTQRPGETRRLVGADASHAWVAVHAPPHGWVELDPTNDRVVHSDHVVVAWGRDFGDVSPLRGVILGGGQHELRVAVEVAPLTATPR